MRKIWHHFSYFIKIWNKIINILKIWEFLSYFFIFCHIFFSKYCYFFLFVVMLYYMLFLSYLYVILLYIFFFFFFFFLIFNCDVYSRFIYQLLLPQLFFSAFYKVCNLLNSCTYLVWWYNNPNLIKILWKQKYYY